MKLKYSLILLIFLFNFQFINSQDTFGIKFLGNEREQVCQKFNQAFYNRPKETRFSIVRVNQSLFFETNDKNWFNSLFPSNNDGMAIDIVSKSRYSCNYETVESKQIRGLLQRPIYAQKLKSGLKKVRENYRVLVARIPSSLLNDELEFNILFLNNESLCQYYVVYDLEAYPWDLLDMGLYLDSLTYNNRAIKPVGQESYSVKTKSLKFIIPFEKNKSEYSQEDIKPLYDSLRLTDFNIKSINLKAYASVEGSTERNLELQQERANSIAVALQSFQKPTIKTSISSSENWVEFFKDIENSPYSNMQSLGKAEIKSKLVGELSVKMEPILQAHRKAVVELELERIDKYKSMSTAELITNFNELVKTDNIDEATIIQNSIFEKLKGKVSSPDVLKQMDIPKKKTCINLLNKNAVIKFVLDELQTFIVYNELLELEKLEPNNMKVQYNLMVLKFKLWRHKALDIKASDFKNDISALKNHGVAPEPIQRMMVNYHIVIAENAMRKRDYKTKDTSVKYIDSHYSKFSLSDFDYLSLAQFFSYYANTDLSVKLLKDKVNTIEVNEDLLFYYINLTIIDNKLTQTPDYRTIMLNAFNMNQERYCKLFNPFGEGGVTFQLLEDAYLRNSYCENCNN